MSLFAPQQMFGITLEWIWHATLSASILTVLLLITQKAFGRLLSARWLYLLWVCVLLRLLMPLVPASSISILNLVKLEHGGVTPARATFEVTMATPAPNGVWRDSQTARTIPELTPVATAEERSVSSRFIPGVVWLSGALGYLGMVFLQHRRWSGWVKRQPSLTDPTIRRSLSEAHQIVGCTKTVDLIATNSLTAPSLFGFWKPKLLLPTSLNLSAAELRLVLTHELMHVKRHDVLLNWLMIVIQALHWFNPVIWLGMRRLRAARESWCDELVISRLQADERKLYGATLIKLIDSFSRVPSTLIPIINRKKQMHQRIAMIAKFKPTTRLMSAVSAAMLLTIACLTFTRAAEKPVSTPPAATEKAELDRIKSKEAAERGIATLEKILDEQTRLVRHKEDELDQIKKKLGISELEEGGQVGSTESMRTLESLKIEAQADQTQITALLDQLRGLSRTELRKAISTASPDQRLTTLFEQQASAEQKLAVLNETYGKDHPEVRTMHRLVERITQQIEERLDGILAGLKAKAASYQARTEHLEKELLKLREREMEGAIARRPYFQAKRDLESHQAVRERLRVRLIQEQIDAAVPR